jgi:ABC-type multidrug transport system ATPase subunit
MDESIRSQAGVLLEDIGLYESLSVYDNLKLFSDIYGCDAPFFESRIDFLLKKLDIYDCKYKVIKNFSLEMLP